MQTLTLTKIDHHSLSSTFGNGFGKPLDTSFLTEMAVQTMTTYVIKKEDQIEAYYHGGDFQ